MTNNEIIQGLSCCQSEYGRNCIECPYEKYKTSYIPTITCSSRMRKDVLDLINQYEADKEALISGQETLQKYITEQKTEIEKLQNDLKFAQSIIKRLQKYDEEQDMQLHIRLIQTAQIEIIEEFTKKLKCGVPQETGIIRCADIDNIAKEMMKRYYGI